MLRGFYTAASGMLTQQRRQEALANNLANQNTPGFKADQPVMQAFPEMLMQRMEAYKSPIRKHGKFMQRETIGTLHTGAVLQEMIPNHQQGDLRETGVLTDLALVYERDPDDDSNLFFTVQNNDGELRLTRNGNFTIDGEGFLVTTQGYYILDIDGNPIQTNDYNFQVTSEGMIQAGEETFFLGIAYVEDVHVLEAEGNDLFNGEIQPLPEEVSYSVHQGHLERSNVNLIQTMTQMMESYRQFELNQRVLRAYDESMDKAVNEIGRIG